MNKAVILLSGGLDSATTLFIAKKMGYKPYCLIFDYGQRHRKEIHQAKKLAQAVKSPYSIVKFGMPWKGSSLLDKKLSLPKDRLDIPNEIPSTYVPARNIIFLSFAASYAEAIGATRIFIGANAIDYSGYPDCRPRFFKAYEKVLQEGMKIGVEGHAIKIEAPLLWMTKAEIIKCAIELKVPIELTWSCYQGGRKPCGMCDSCVLRRRGFEEVEQKLKIKMQNRK